MFVLFREGCADEADVCETLDEVKRVIEERCDSYSSYAASDLEDFYSNLRLYSVGQRIPLSYIPATFNIGSYETAGIPAPLPGETVSDYARRITNG